MDRGATSRDLSPSRAGSQGRLNLAGLQASLVAAVTARDAASDPLLNSIQARGSICANDRIAAYCANVSGAHLNALDQVYPVIREVLGARYWRQLLHEEIEAFASTTADLHAYGEFIPEMLQAAQQRRPELQAFPYLGELATLEWHVHCIRFTSDASHFDWKAFAALRSDLQSLATLTLSSALRVFRPGYPVDVIWHAHQAAGETAPESGPAAACCIHRVNRFDITVTRLSHANASLLMAIDSGSNLGTLAQDAGLTQSEAIIRQLYEWIQRRWIVDFEAR